MKVKTLALTPLFLIVLVVCLQTPAATAILPPTPPPPAELLWMNLIRTDDIALSKDGQYVAAVRPLVDSGELAFYGRSSGTPMWTWTYELRGSLSSVAISYDGSCVAAGGGGEEEGYVFFWNNAKSRTLDTEPTWTSVDLGGPIEYRCLAISDDGNYVVAGGTGLNVFYWANAKSSGPSPVSPTWMSGLPGLVEAVDMSSDGDYVVAGYGTDVAYWKNARSLGPGSVGPAWLSTDPDDQIMDVAVSDDGNYVAAAGMLGVSPVYYWANAKSLSDDPTTTWESASGVNFSSIDMSSDGNKVIAGATGGPNPEDIGVYFWDGARTRSGTEDWSWHYTTAGPVHDVAINDAGDYMAAANGFPTPYVYFFDSAGDLKWTYEIFEEAYLLSISSDGGTLAIGTGAFTSRFLVSTGYSTPTRAVGGVLLPADKLALLSPWMAIALAGLAVTVFATKRRRKP